MSPPLDLFAFLVRYRREALTRDVRWKRDEEGNRWVGRLPEGYSCKGHAPLFLELSGAEEPDAWQLRSERDVLEVGQFAGRLDPPSAKRFAIDIVARRVAQKWPLSPG